MHDFVLSGLRVQGALEEFCFLLYDQEVLIFIPRQQVIQRIMHVCAWWYPFQRHFLIHYYFCHVSRLMSPSFHTCHASYCSLQLINIGFITQLSDQQVSLKKPASSSSLRYREKRTTESTTDLPDNDYHHYDL